MKETKAYIGGRIMCGECGNNMERGSKGLTCTTKGCSNNGKFFEVPCVTLKEVKKGGR